MYRDVAQWTGIRRRILRDGVSICQVVRETGISGKTVCKMLKHPLPKRYGPRSRRYPKLGPYTATVQRILRENCTLPPSARLSIRNIHECISCEGAFSGSYDSVRRYAAQFFRDAGRVAGVAPKPDPREQLRLYAFEWMRAVLQKEISSEMLRCEVGDSS